MHRTIADPRLRHLITACAVRDLPKASPHAHHVAVLGFPYGEGTTRNSGNLGGSEGPSEFRHYFYKIGSLINPENGYDLTGLQLYDCGDIEKNLVLEEAHSNLRHEVGMAIKKGYIPIVIGGSNDQSFPNGMGLVDNLTTKSDVAVINIDAHLDVRELTEDGLAHSGSPFYQLLTNEHWDGKFIEFAAQGHQCGKVHADFVLENSGDIMWFNKHLRGNDIPKIFERTMLGTEKNNWFVSFDIDSISSDFCDSVSCPTPIGLSAQDALDICYVAGQHRQTKLIDFSEFNPNFGNVEKTGRLLSTMVYYFLLGLNTRPLLTANL